MQLQIDHVTRTVRPLDREGDAHYGLAVGTNGTGPAMRRHAAPEGYTWRRHDGRPAVGIYLQGSGLSLTWRNPWDGAL